MEEKKIQKPWAVYGWFLGSWAIGKVKSEGYLSLDIQYCEGQMYPPSLWDSKWVKTFDNPIKAIAYFHLHNHEGYSKKQVIDKFLSNFPSERVNLENLLKQSAQTSPKLTSKSKDYIEQHCCPHIKNERTNSN